MKIYSLFRILLLILSAYFPYSVSAVTINDADGIDKALSVLVISPSHPSSDVYYSNSMPSFRFTTGSDSATRYSYLLNRTPTALPDDIPEPVGQDYISYPLHSGAYFFHIKATTDGINWGDVTHHQIQIDVDQPKISSVDFQNNRLLLNAVDAHSGIKSYEARIISRNDLGAKVLQFETSNNWIEFPELSEGDYDLLVRVSDRAGNSRDLLLEITITDGIFGRSINFSNSSLREATKLFVAICIFTFASLFYYSMKRHHDLVHQRYLHREVSARTKRHIAHVEKVRRRRLHVLIPFVLFGFVFTYYPGQLNAAPMPTSPVITILPTKLHTEKTFYVGGISEYTSGQVVLSIEQIDTNDRSSVSVPVGEDGSWFYRADDFLDPGKYRLEAEYVNGEFVSPKTEGYSFTVKKGLFIEQELRIIYSLINVLLSIGLILLLFRTLHLRKKIITKMQKMDEERKKEEGEALARLHRLKTDLETELNEIQHLKLTREFKKNEIGREKQLDEDIREIERIITHQKTSNNKVTDL